MLRPRHGHAQRVVDPPARDLRRSARAAGKIGRPAASADVHPAGRSALLRRSNTAPLLARQPTAASLRRRTARTACTCRAARPARAGRLPRRRPRPARSGGIGYGPGSDSARYPVKRTGDPRLRRRHDVVRDPVRRVRRRSPDAGARRARCSRRTPPSADRPARRRSGCSADRWRGRSDTRTGAVQRRPGRSPAPRPRARAGRVRRSP